MSQRKIWELPSPLKWPHGYYGQIKDSQKWEGDKFGKKMTWWILGQKNATRQAQFLGVKIIGWHNKILKPKYSIPKKSWPKK